MSYLQFLLQWFNWPYLAALALAAGSLAYRPFLRGVGLAAAPHLGLERTPGHSVVRMFGLTFAIVGLTVNGALHDYWPSAQQAGFLPGLIFTATAALFVTRRLGRYRERHFPQIKAIGLGSPELGGLEGRIVSRSVGPDYRAGRAQVMDAKETLHMVMCKTSGEHIPYGARVVLGEYDSSDGRYYVAPLDEDDEETDGTGSEARG